uniref:Uncharacterized protein n=1 Tax=Anguilla anguilla TaxID=7936 RepID=A0A0E9XTZ6_ANGAN
MRLLRQATISSFSDAFRNVCKLDY